MDKRTRNLLIGFGIAAILGYFLFKEVREWISNALKSVVAVKTVGKVTSGVAGRAIDGPGRGMLGR